MVNKQIIAPFKELGEGETKTYEFSGVFAGQTRGKHFIGFEVGDKLLFSFDTWVYDIVSSSIDAWSELTPSTPENKSEKPKAYGKITYAADKRTPKGFLPVTATSFEMNVEVTLSKRKVQDKILVEKAIKTVTAKPFNAPTIYTAAPKETPAVQPAQAVQADQAVQAVQADQATQAA